MNETLDFSNFGSVPDCNEGRYNNYLSKVLSIHYFF